jgi:hypothetical protein
MLVLSCPGFLLTFPIRRRESSRIGSSMCAKQSRDPSRKTDAVPPDSKMIDDKWIPIFQIQMKTLRLLSQEKKYYYVIDIRLHLRSSQPTTVPNLFSWENQWYPHGRVT